MNPFDPSSWAAAESGPNTAIPAFLQGVGNAGDERRFGADHDQLDLLALGQRDDFGDVAGIGVHAFGPARNSGIARRRNQSTAGGRLPKAPGERIFPAART